METKKQIAALKDLRMYAVSCSAVGDLVATAHMNATIRIWNRKDMSLRSEIKVGESFVYGALAFSKDGLWLASDSTSGRISIWDPSTGEKAMARKQDLKRKQQYHRLRLRCFCEKKTLFVNVIFVDGVAILDSNKNSVGELLVILKKPAHEDWTGLEESLQMERVESFTRRFAYLLDGMDLNKTAKGSAFWTPKALLKQMETHYREHTANVSKKKDLPEWPKD